MMKSIIVNKFLLKKLALIITLSGLFYNLVIAYPPEKRTATIQLSYYKKINAGKTAVATVKAKNNEGRFLPAINLRVNFYLVNKNEIQLIKSAYTDQWGKAVITLSENLPVDTGSCFTIIAKIEDDKIYEDASEQFRYKDANLSFRLNPLDTSRNATVVLTVSTDKGNEIPVQDVEIKFYVQRLFGIMPATEDYIVNTDEKGEASFAYPKDIPGDTASVITIVSRIEDNETFGNIENKASAFWGSRLLTEKEPFPRALWEPYAPLPLIITISLLFGGVWITYSVIFYNLRKIKKEKSDEQIEFEAVINQ